MLLSLLSVWGDIRANVQCPTGCYELLLKQQQLFIEQSLGMLLLRNSDSIPLIRASFLWPSMSWAWPMDCKSTKSMKESSKTAQNINASSYEVTVQVSICSSSCLASSLHSPWRGLGSLEKWIHSIVTLLSWLCQPIRHIFTFTAVVHMDIWHADMPKLELG